MSEDMTGEEANLLAELGRALGPDRLPAGLVERADALVAFADFDRQLARLLETQASEPVGVRGTAAPGVLLFATDGGSVCVEVHSGRESLDGQVVAGAVTEVVLERLSGVTATARVDDLGRFGFAQPDPGPARLRLHGVHIGQLLAVTDWFIP